MPSLFGSRRRGSSASRQPLDHDTNYAASVAARAAAASSRPASSSGLSSAAAAAALRSHTSSPEPIGSIQTKRMVRRGSQSSIGSSSILSGRGGPGRGGLQRRGSQSSMTERTFRASSPGRSNSLLLNGASSPTFQPPPVPPLPRSVQQRAHQRSASVGAPYRVSSPTPRGKGGRSNSMDRSTMSPPPSHRKGARLSNVNEELEGPDGQRGVNFSRPRSSNANSPSSSPVTDKAYTHGTGAWFSEPVPVPNKSAGSTAPRADAAAAKMARIQGAQGQTMRKVGRPASAQGNQLRLQTQPTITGTAVMPQVQPQQDMETVMVFDAATRTFVPKLQPRAAPAPPSPLLPPPTAAAPGTYDPHTRTIVPAVQPAGPPPKSPGRPSLPNSPRGSYRGSVNGDASKSDRILQAAASSARASAPTTRQQRASSLDVPDRNTPSNRGRQVSASPSPGRKTHFSASPVSEATRHDPPARDISPAKSALKHSPSSSVRANSPVPHFATQPKAPPSETSDATSVYSQDGLSSAKKKKSVHVKFDEQPHEIDVKAAASPQIWSRERSPALDDLDDEEFSKPRPALPTFGSVRRNRDVAEKVTEMAPDRNEHSNDHALGGILRNANGSAKPGDEPMPPVVISKEAPADISDTDSDVGDLGEYAAANAATVNLPEQVEEQKALLSDKPSQKKSDQPIVKDFGSPTAAQTAESEVPEITLLPPTPGVEENKSLNIRQSAEIVVPGGWSADTDAAAKPAIQSSVTPSIAPVLVHTPEEQGPVLAPIDEDTTDTEAEFSDAAEDPSELEGGYASLNAIAVSPINVKSSPALHSPTGTTSPPDTPTTIKAPQSADGRAAGEERTSADWSSTTAYWSKLSKQQREQIERDHMSSDDEARPSPAAMKKTRKTTAKTAAGSSPQSILKSAPAHREAKPAQPALKKTMRAQPEPVEVEKAHTMRRSMRDGGFSSGSSRSRPASTSQASSEPRAGALSKKTMRPQSSASLSASSAGSALTNARVSQDPARPALTRPQSSASTVGGQPTLSARLQKELSHDSDSESSFKKKRRGNAAPNGSISMKRSMRAPLAEQRPSSPDAGRSKGKSSLIRSLSPTGSLFGRKKMTDVRDSIRGGSIDGSSSRTTLRNGPPAKTMRQTSTAASKQNGPSTKFKSRFVDSDDSDDEPSGARPAFRSRFMDSDDSGDELTPVRGIPRRKGQDDGDSTDLEDSEDDPGRKPFARSRQKQATPLVPDPAAVDKAMEAARKKLGMTNGFTSAPSTPQKHDEKEGTLLAQGSLRNSQPPPVRPQSPELGTPKKKGFMGSLLRRNRASQHSVMTVSGVPHYDSAAFAESMPTSSPILSKQALERPQSPASPGKLVRRTSAQTRQTVTRGDSNYSTATAPPATGDSSWPLADAPPVPALPANVDQLKAAGSNRPATSDGHVGVRFSEDAIAAKREGVYSMRTGKKKKFGALRRAFGLHD